MRCTRSSQHCYFDICRLYWIILTVILYVQHGVHSSTVVSMAAIVSLVAATVQSPTEFLSSAAATGHVGAAMLALGRAITEHGM